MQASMVPKDYWYYSNDSYELESQLDISGTTHLLSRNITGPIPWEDVCSIVRGSIPINPAIINWQQLVEQRLTQSRFNITNINNRIADDCGITFLGYLKSFLHGKQQKKWL